MSRVRPIAAAALLGSLIALLSACGFALRGQSQLPPEMAKTALLGASARSPLGTQLRLLLGGHGIDVVTPAAGAARLRIHRDDMQREVQSVGASARVREFALRYTVVFSLEDPAGQTLVAPQTLELTRVYTFDQSEVLGAASEEEFLRAELTRNMAREIVVRIELAAH